MGTSAAAARGRPRSSQADERIIAVALDQLSSAGYRDLSMERVAAEAGVSKATVYRRYRDKADLATAALAVVSAAKLAPPLPDGTRDAMVELLRRFESGVGRVGLGVLASFLDEADPTVLDLHRERTIARGLARARWVLERGQERGEIRPDADLDAALHMLFGALFARRLIGHEIPRWRERVVDALLRGVAR
jgi:AcrR family transcriptional regulator